MRIALTFFVFSLLGSCLYLGFNPELKRLQQTVEITSDKSKTLFGTTIVSGIVTSVNNRVVYDVKLKVTVYNQTGSSVESQTIVIEKPLQKGTPTEFKQGLQTKFEDIGSVKTVLVSGTEAKPEGIQN